MTVVTVLRELWSRRLLVAVGFALATAAAILMAFSVKPGLPPTFTGRQYNVGVASAGVLVDSPSSLSIDLTGGQSKADVESLSARARLLANLMATSPLKEQIARRAGVVPDRMIATAPTIGPAVDPFPVQIRASKVKPTDPDANILTVYVNEVLPIITAAAQAPEPATAARISTAAVQELTTYLKTVAATDRVPDARRLVIKPLGPATSATVTRGPRRLLAVIVFALVFGSWCAGIVFVTAVARNWREASAAEATDPDGGPAARPEAGPRASAPATAEPHAGAAEEVRPRAYLARGRQPVAPVARRDLPERSERPFRAL